MRLQSIPAMPYLDSTWAMAPPVTTGSFPPVAFDWAARHSTTGKDLRKEAVIRRSGGLQRLRPYLHPCSPEQTLWPRPPISTHGPAKEAKRPPSCPGGPHVPPPRPLFPRTIVIIGDSITRNIRFINAITHCFPGATLPDILDKFLDLLPSLLTSIKRIVVHVGTNHTTHQDQK